MARKKQELINFHGSQRAGLEGNKTDLKFGEIGVAMGSKEQAGLAIKISGDTLEWFITSAQTSEAIEAVKSEAASGLTALSAATEAFSAATVSAITNLSASTYTTIKEFSAATVSAITILSGVVVDAVSAMTLEIKDDAGNPGADIKADGRTYTFYQGGEKVGSINVVKDSFVADGRVELSGDTAYLVLDLIERSVSGETSGQTVIKTVKIDASSLVDAGAIRELSGAVETLSSATVSTFTELSAATESFSAATVSAITNLSASTYTTIKEFSAATVSAMTVLSGNIITYVDEKLSAATADLAELSAATEAFSAATVDALNALSANSLTGVTLNGVKFAVSGNVASSIIYASGITLGTELEYSGTTIAATETVVEALDDIINIIVDNEEVTAAALNDLNDKVEGLSASVITNYATSADTVAAIEAVKQEASSGLTALSSATIAFSAATVSAITNLSASTYTTIKEFSAATVSAMTVLSGNIITYVDKKLSAATADLAELSAATESFSAATVSAITNLSASTYTTIKEFSAATVDALNALSANSLTGVTLNGVKFEVSGNVASSIIYASGITLGEDITYTGKDEETKEYFEDETILYASGTTSQAIKELVNIILDDEKVTAAALTDLDDRLGEIEDSTVSNVTFEEVAGGERINDHDSGARATIANNTLKIDLANLVIDCGTWD